MVKNFEDYTIDLTQEEWENLGEVMNLLISYLPTDKKKAKSQIKVAEYLSLNLPIQITPVRLRRYINYFRGTGTLPIIAISKGCYISYSESDLNGQIISLTNRINGIRFAMNGIQKILDRQSKKELEETLG